MSSRNIDPASTMRKPKVIPLIDPEQSAKTLFSEHVQSIAFNLTLSHRMISLLQVVRDYGFPMYGENDQWKEMSKVTTIQKANGSQSGQYIKFVRAVESRGLVIHHWPVKKGEPSVTLSKVGELVCELLVLSGLMTSKEKVQNAKRKKA